PPPGPCLRCWPCSLTGHAGRGKKFANGWQTTGAIFVWGGSRINLIVAGANVFPAEAPEPAQRGASAASAVRGRLLGEGVHHDHPFLAPRLVRQHPGRQRRRLAAAGASASPTTKGGSHAHTATVQGGGPGGGGAGPAPRRVGAGEGGVHRQRRFRESFHRL